MNRAKTAPPDLGASPASTAGIVLTLARAEARRILRSPLLYAGLVVSGLFSTSVFRTDTDASEWWEAGYSSAPVMFVPVLIPAAVLVSAAFHREREPVGTDAPTSASARAAGILLGAAPVVLLIGFLTLGLALFVSSVDGFYLGDEPGRTAHARFSVFELLQHVALAVLAISTGAAAGRRLAHRFTAALVLFAGWFPPMVVYWMFQVPAVVPFSIVQVQPVNVRIAPRDTDPRIFPAEWLLSRPAEFQDYWGRLYVSSSLAGWHDLWLLGLACLFLALVFTGPWRHRLLVAGIAGSVVSIAAQYWLIP